MTRALTSKRFDPIEQMQSASEIYRNRPLQQGKSLRWMPPGHFPRTFFSGAGMGKDTDPK